jgi:hypothetical protein
MISVIVPARNEQRALRACLGALRSQSLPTERFEIVVMDNGSTDDTVSIARAFTERVYLRPGVTVGMLRNEGAGLARGSVLAFIDADCIASPTWLEGALDALADGGVAVGNKYDRPAGGSWIEALWLGDAVKGRVATGELWTGNLVVTRDAFEASGGFDGALVSSEDVLLSRRLADCGELFLDGRVRVTHYGGPRTLTEFARQQLWHGFEEWSLFRRGITRDSLVPAVVCAAGLAMLLGSWALSAPARWIALTAGAVLIAGATARRMSFQRHSLSGSGVQALIRLATLNFVFLMCRAAAIVLSACGITWSGRRKTIVGTSVGTAP